MLLVGNISALELRFIGSWRGPWLVDADLELGSEQALPAGDVVLTVGTAKLKGAIDPRATGRFGEKGKARVVAGRGGWGSPVVRRDFHNDAPRGITSTDVLQGTASEVGETVNDPSPINHGTYFERLAGRASAVLDGRDWYVDANGVTQVQAWPTLQLGADALVLSYDPDERIAKIAADEIVWPGTVITDARFGTITVRDVDQRFTQKGSRVDAYHNTAGLGRFDAALELLIKSLAGTEWATSYEYRVKKTNDDGRLELVAARKSDGVPDVLPIPVWAGIPGLSVNYSGNQVGSGVRVVFLGGDRTRPIIVSFDGQPATSMILSVITQLVIGDPNFADFVALAGKTQGNLDKLNNALVTVGLPVIGGGGGTAKLANPIVFDQVAAERLKVQ